MNGIKIFYDQLMHNTTSYIIGANRNHLIDEPNLAGKLEAYSTIKPVFGEKRKLYRLGHGPTDGRLDEPHKYMKGYHFEDWWGRQGPYPYDDLRLGLNESKKLDADLTVVVNYGSGTAEEAGRLVSYLNRSEDTVRKSHGDPAWNVKYFELGNEVTWRLQVGHDPYAISPEVYARRAKTFAAAMRANSDIPIKIGLVGSINGSWINDHWPNDESDDRVHNISTMIDIMGDDVDFVIYHGYPQLTGSDLNLMSSNQWFRDKLVKKVMPTLREAEVRNRMSHTVEIANSEYFSSEYGSDHTQGTLEALYTADTMVTAINLDLKMAVNFCFSSNVRAQSLFFLEDDPFKPTPVFAVHKLAAEFLGDHVISAEGAGIPTTPVQGLYGGELENLSYAATKCADGSIAMLVVNRVEAKDITIAIDLGMQIKEARLITLSGRSYRDQHMVRQETPVDDLDKVNFPGTSVSILKLML